MWTVETLTRVVFFFLVFILFLSLVIYRCAFLMEPLNKRDRIIRKIKKLKKEIKKLKELKIETEEKYYKREIDEKSFESLMRAYQEEIVKRENHIKLLKKFAKMK